MTYTRLPYDDDAAHPSQMAADGLAAHENLPGLRSVESAVTEEFNDYPVEGAVSLVIPQQAADLAADFEIHLS